MKKNNTWRLRSGVAVTALMLAAVTPALAQEAAPVASAATPAPVADETVVIVTGIRSSLKSAQTRKKNASQIVDSIVADDIGKLPDVNVTEALQRVSGIQVSRDRGEGGSVLIRGLSQVLSTLNGREIFTADGGRGFNLQDMPSELVSAIDVYKTPSADKIEGGIGGVIDIRTRKPFDFKGQTISGSLRGRYGDLVDKTSPLGSLLYSNRWHTNMGEMGLLLSYTYQERAFRTDTPSAGATTPRTDLIAGKTIFAPNGTYEPLIAGTRHRKGFDGTFQWRPMDNLELYAQYSHEAFDSEQQQFGLNNPSNGVSVVPGSVTLFDGTDNMKSATFTNVAISTYGVERDTYDENDQYAIGGKWTLGRHALSAEAEYQKSSNYLYYGELDLATTAPVGKLDVSNPVPSFLFSGIDLTQIGSYRRGGVTQNINDYQGDQKAFRIDDRISFDNSFITSVDVGARVAERQMTFTPIRFSAGAAAVGTTASAYSDLYQMMPYDDYVNSDAGVTHQFLVAKTDMLRNGFDAMLDKFTDITTRPAVSPLSIFDINEKTEAVYVSGNFRFDTAWPIDGNLGVRAVTTKLGVIGNKAVYTPTTVGGVTTYTQTGYASVNRESEQTDILPSFNARMKLNDQWQVRVASSKTMTRPSFSQLSPSVTLVPGQGTASSGNPDLEPIKSTQFDLSVEYYFAATGSAYLAYFDRNTTGFIANTVTPGVVIDNITYNLTQPVNSRSATIKGVEVGGQMFFDMLPAPFDGFGVQANYTRVNSEANLLNATFITPLSGLSKDSYNISGLYEKGPLSMRLAYNWRSKFLTGLFTGTGGALSPIYQEAYGWLDASINYDLTDHVTLTAEASNMLQTEQITYYQDPTRPGGYTIDDRQYMVGVRFKY